MGPRKSSIAKIIFKKKNKARNIKVYFWCFKVYWKAIVLKTVWYWHKTRHADQCNITESLELNPRTYTQVFYDSSAGNIQCKNKQKTTTVFFNKSCWENWKATCKTMKQDCYPKQYAKNNSKWIKDKCNTWNH